ncbi:MAG: hypothetical protein WAS51_14450 [Ilumatobacteraceae bacterium]
MTRADLITLRNTGGLSKDCDYVVTDHVQGRLVAGTTVHLQAVDGSTLSRHAIVKSTYDNIAWDGEYDIDTGLVYALEDNRNNRVIGAAAVAAFDWGNTAYTDCTVEHSTWTATIGNTRPMTRVRVLDGATLNTSGMTSGSLTNVEVSKASSLNCSGMTGGSVVSTEVSNQSNVTLQNGNLSLQYATITDNSSLTASGYTAGGTGVLRSRIAGGSSVTFGPGSGTVLMQNASVLDAASVSHTGTGSFTFSSSRATDSCSVVHSSTGVFNASGCVIEGVSSTIQHTLGEGSLSMTGSKVGPYGRVLKTIAGALGALSLNYCVIDTLGYVQQSGAGAMSMTGARVSGNSYVSTQSGSNVSSMTVNYSTLTDSSYVTASASATAGTMSVSQCLLGSNAFIEKTGTGNISVASSSLFGTGRVQLAGVRSLAITGCFLANIGRVLSNASAGAGVTDVMLYASCQDYAVVQFLASGAAPNAVRYSSARGLTANITFSGVNTGTEVSRMTVDNGNVTFSNNTAAFPNIVDIGVRDQGVLSVSGCSAAQDIRYSTIGSYGRWNMTSRTVAAASYGIDVSVQGTFNQNGAASTALYVDVRHGVITQNGGTLSNVSKSMGGTLTTGNFAHSNIQHHANTTKTLTAANTSRADYQGLAAQLV